MMELYVTFKNADIWAIPISKIVVQKPILQSHVFVLKQSVSFYRLERSWNKQ